MLVNRQIKELIEKVSNRMMNMKNESDFEEGYPVGLIDMNCWEWPQGVGLYGLYKYYTQTKGKRTLDFLESWFDNHIKDGVGEKNINTTAPMLTLAHLYEILPKKEYLDLIEEWCQWIMDPEGGLIRTGDGCFQHMITGNPNPDEILIDTLFMTILFLAKSGKLLNRSNYTDEANYQVQSHILYLYEKNKGLFYHGWNFKAQNNYGEVFWGRGNGWYTIGILELLEIEEDMDKSIYRNFINIYKHQVNSILKYQDAKNHLWHTVIDDAESYIEISASSAFLSGIIKGIRLGILDEKDYSKAVENGLQNIFDYIDNEGTVLNVSYGTPIGHNKEFYKSIPCCPITYGQAMMILMLQEVLLY